MLWLTSLSLLNYSLANMTLRGVWVVLEGPNTNIDVICWPMQVLFRPKSGIYLSLPFYSFSGTSSPVRLYALLRANLYFYTKFNIKHGSHFQKGLQNLERALQMQYTEISKWKATWMCIPSRFCNTSRYFKNVLTRKGWCGLYESSLVGYPHISRHLLVIPEFVVIS